VLARRASPPLLEILTTVNKTSHNLFAELSLRAVSPANGVEELNRFAAEIGVAPGATHFEDGSGLSRKTLVTAESVTRLLGWMHRSPHAAAWLDTLPVGAADGTVKSRFVGVPSASAIYAKTGSLRGVAALSGYIVVGERRRLAFSIIANDSNAPASELREIVDRIAVEILRRGLR
jgi:D-alanyl-D-alanine carboxypeptidase/D-alanyl-D-alanine-endopeptidase (penicillin-binding protein 4)